MRSSSSSVRHVPTAAEEEETDTSHYRYIPRTLPQGRPFYGTSSESTSSDNSHGQSRRSSTKSVRRTKRDDNEPQSFWNPQFPMHYASANNSLSAQHLNVPSADLFEDVSNISEDEHDDQSQPSNDNNSKRETRNPTFADLDIKNIHGRNHYGKLETTPTMDHQDRLWTQIDALDDVKKLASNVDLYEGFPPDFEEQLGKLRLAHCQLLNMMRDRDSLLDEDRTKSDTEKTIDYGFSPEKSIANTASRMGTSPTSGKTVSNGANNLSAKSTVPSSPPYPATDRDKGSVSNTTDTNTKDTKNSQQSNKIVRSATVPSRIQTDEDKYVQDMVNIMKQLRV